MDKNLNKGCIYLLVLMKAEKIDANLFMCRIKWRRVNDDVASQTWSYVRIKFEDSL